MDMARCTRVRRWKVCLFESWLCYSMLRRRGGASRREVYRHRSRAQAPIHIHAGISRHTDACGCVGISDIQVLRANPPNPDSRTYFFLDLSPYRYPNLLRMRGTTLTHAICTRPSLAQFIKAPGSPFSDSICTRQHAHASTTGASTVGSGAIGSMGSFTKMG